MYIDVPTARSSAVCEEMCIELMELCFAKWMIYCAVYPKYFRVLSSVWLIRFPILLNYEWDFSSGVPVGEMEAQEFPPM